MSDEEDFFEKDDRGEKYSSFYYDIEKEQWMACIGNDKQTCISSGEWIELFIEDVHGKINKDHREGNSPFPDDKWFEFIKFASQLEWGEGITQYYNSTYFSKEKFEETRKNIKMDDYKSHIVYITEDIYDQFLQNPVQNQEDKSNVVIAEDFKCLFYDNNDKEVKVCLEGKENCTSYDKWVIIFFIQYIKETKKTPFYGNDEDYSNFMTNYANNELINDLNLQVWEIGTGEQGKEGTDYLPLIESGVDFSRIPIYFEINFKNIMNELNTKYLSLGLGKKNKGLRKKPSLISV